MLPTLRPGQSSRELRSQEAGRRHAEAGERLAGDTLAKAGDGVEAAARPAEQLRRGRFPFTLQQNSVLEPNQNRVERARRQADGLHHRGAGVGGMRVVEEQLEHLETLLGQPVVYNTNPTRPVNSWKKSWQSAKKSAKVTIRFHDLRHTAVTRMLEGGVPLSVVASIMGWSAATTARMAKRYGHIGQSAQRQAVAVLDKVAKRSKKTKTPKRPTEQRPHADGSRETDRPN
jgi:Phage integrase family